MSMLNFRTAVLSPIDPKELVGKTIIEVMTGDNVLLVEFDDNTQIVIQYISDHYDIHRMELRPDENRFGFFDHTDNTMHYPDGRIVQG